MRLPFIELLELEQRVALVAAVVRRMGDMGLLADQAAAREPVEVARDLIGATDMASAERWAMVNAAVSVGAKALDAAAIITSDWVAPTMRTMAESTGRVADRLANRSRSRYVVIRSTPLPTPAETEVKVIE